MPVIAHPDLLSEFMRKHSAEVGAEIAKRRIEKGYGPTKFCALIGGLSLQTLHRIEHGQSIPKDHHKAAIAMALEIDLDELYSWPSNEEIIKGLAA